MVVDNTLDRQFDVEAPSSVWAADITYIKTHEGFSYLSIVIDMFSRRIAGLMVQNRQPTDLVLQALLMAAWRRKPTGKVLVHSDQDSQFISIDWTAFLKHHNLEHSMSRRGNCPPCDGCFAFIYRATQQCGGREYPQPTKTRAHPSKNVKN